MKNYSSKVRSIGEKLENLIGLIEDDMSEINDKIIDLEFVQTKSSYNKIDKYQEQIDKLEDLLDNLQNAYDFLSDYIY